MEQTPDILVRWTLPASLLGHVLLLAAVLSLAVPRTLERPQMRAIAVDLVNPPPQRPKAVSRPPEMLASVADEAEPAAAEASVDSDGMVAATDFYAAGILSDPANAEIRRNFPLLATGEQVTQLCNMEALEQLRSADPAVPADALVGYAFGSIDVHGRELDAQGGAVRSAGNWFHFRYHCAVAPDVASVSAFEYAMGPAIPQDQWEEHFLNADDDWLN